MRIAARHAGWQNQAGHDRRDDYPQFPLLPTTHRSICKAEVPCRPRALPFALKDGPILDSVRYLIDDFPREALAYLLWVNGPPSTRHFSIIP